LADGLARRLSLDRLVKQEMRFIEGEAGGSLLEGARRPPSLLPPNPGETELDGKHDQCAAARKGSRAFLAPVVGSSRNCLDRRYLSSSVLALNDLDAGNDGDLFGQAEGKKRCGAHLEASLLPGSWHCYLNARVGVTTTASRPSSLAIERGLHTVKSRGSLTGVACGYCRFERGRTRTRTA
jgi:hypothetical protein